MGVLGKSLDDMMDNYFEYNFGKKRHSIKCED